MSHLLALAAIHVFNTSSPSNTDMLPECLQEPNIHAGKWCLQLPDDFAALTCVAKTSIAFGEHAHYGKGGQLYGTILSSAHRSLLLKATDDTDYGSVDSYCKELSLDAEDAEPPITKTMMDDLNRSFLTVVTRFLSLIVFFGANHFSLTVQQNWLHEKLKQPMLELERSRSTDLSDLQDPRPGDLCGSAASRDFTRILVWINSLVYTATWEQHVSAANHFRLLTLGRCWTNARFIINWLVTVKVVSTWPEFAVVVRKKK